MDQHGFYTDQNSSFSSITNSSNFSDNILPSISNYKYQSQQPSLSGSIYQQPVQTLPDHQQQQHQQHQQHQQQQIPPTIKQQIPQTQININNCNNNIFFPPHDDGLFDSNTSSSCAAVSSNINSNNNNSNNTSNQKNNNIIGYVRKAESGGENITYNINNINTNIVNNINNNNNTTTNSSTSSSSNSTNNPAGLVNGGDIYGGNNQYHHQINKNGETIINFTNNNNLNHNNTNNSSMPLDSVSASSQNYYYHSNQSNLGQQTFEASSVHSQNTSTSTNSYLNPILSANKSMGTTGTGLYHGHHHHQSASGTTNPIQQSAPQPPPSNGSYISGNNNSLSHEHNGTAGTVASYGDFPESISTAAKIINNFESKNPIKYQTTNRMPSGYYKSDYPAPQYSTTHSHHLPPHHGINYGIYSGHPSAAIPTGINKMSSHSSSANPLHSYENTYPNRVPRKPSHYSTSQYYPAPSNPMPQQAHTMDDSRNHYSRTVIQHPTAAYHHPLPPPPSHHNYGAYFTNGVNRYSMPYPSYSHYPPNQQPSVRNESCSKSAQSYAKPSGQMVSVSEPPSNYTLTHPNVYQPTKKSTTEYYSDSPYLPHHYYEDPIGHLNSCAKKASRPKVNSSDVYIPQSTSNLYTDHHGLQQYHHQPGGNVMRNMNYQQPMPKVYNSPYTLPTEPLNSCEHANYYQNVNYSYKTSDHHGQMVKSTTGPKMNPALSSKQFKNYYDFPPQQPPQFASNLPQYHTMQAKHPEKLKISIDLEDQITGSKIPKMRDAQHPTYAYDYSPYYQHYHIPSRNVPLDGEKNQINLRDFLSSWNEIDDDEEGGVKRHQTHPLGILDELNEHVEHVERSIMREYNPMFGQKPHDSIINSNSITSGLPVTANLTSSTVVDTRKQHNQLADVNGIVNDSAPEKLYVLESIEVPISELNKYKHLSVINKLPENVVPIEADKEFYDVESSMKFIDEIESNHEKYYKNDLDEEVDFYQQTELKKLCVEPLISEVKTELMELKEDVKSPDNTSQTEVSDNPTSRKSFRKKSLKSAKAPKIKEKILKLKKEKILKPDHRKLRITKKYRKYALNPRPSSNVKSLKTICIDFVNTSTYRNYFREQLSVKIKCSKRQLLDDIKKKFNFDSIKKQQSPINQKMNHSVRINSLYEICDKVLQDKPFNENNEQRSQDNSDIDSDSNDDSDEIFEAHSVEIDAENEVEKFLEQCNENSGEKSCKKMEVDDDNDESTDESEEVIEPQTIEVFPTPPQSNEVSEEASLIVVPTLKDLCKTMLHDLNVNVVENVVYEPSSLHELCESVIYSNRQYFLIEEVSNVPKLQDLCKVILSETNIFINIDETEDVINNDVCMLTQPNVMENYGESSLAAIEDDPIYMVEDNVNAVELFSSSENLNLFEKSELFRKIQSVANIDDDDEILKAIGELHRDNDNNECNNNNNNCNVSNMNLAEANELCTVGSVDNTKFDSVTSFMSYANDDLMHSIQYEEIIPIDLKLEQSKQIIESLRCKYFNRKDVTQRVTIIRKLLKKYLRYQRGNRCKLLWQKNIQHFHEKWLKLQSSKTLLLQSNESDKINRKLSSSYQPNDTILNSHNTNDHHHQIINNESHTIAKEDTCYYPITKPTQHNDSSNTFLDKFDDIEQMENNIPQLLPSIFPSINEYKIERPINSCQHGSSESQVKDISDSKKRKLTFDESLLSIDKMYSKVDNCNGNGSSSSSKDEATFSQHMTDSKYRRESSHRSSSDKHRHDRVYSDQKSRHRERSRHRDRSRNRYHDNRSRHRSRSNHRDNRHHRSYHRSSRHQHYQHRNDQIVHSEARRLIIPSYKLYDKNLDIKLKTKPYVKIERTECVDDMGKHFM